MTLTEIFINYFVPTGLFLIMAGLGLTLSVQDIVRVVAMPKAVIVGLTGQMLLLPVFAFALAFIFQPNPVIAIGLILLAACPGGVTSNGYVLVSRGDVALSVTLTTFSSLMTVVTMPLLTYLAFTTFADGGIAFDLPIANLMRSLATLTVLPIVGGMLLRRWNTDFAEKLREPMRIMAFVILILVIIGNTITSFNTLINNFVAAGLIAGILNIGSMVMGFGLSKLFGLSVEKTISITFEVGIQNLSLVLTLAMAILQRPEYAAFALVYALFMKITCLSFMAYSKRLLRKNSVSDSLTEQALLKETKVVVAEQ